MKQLLIIIFIIVINATAFSQRDQITVYFEYASSKIHPGELDKLKELQQLILKEEIVNLEIYGYTDTTSSVSYNLNLSKLRCETVNKELNSMGTIVAKGEVAPDINYNPATARRCEIYYTYKTVDSPITEVQITPKPQNKFNPIIEDFIDGEAKTISVDIEILFEGGTAITLPESEIEARQLLFTLRDYPMLKAVIHGHVCCNDDMQLSVERAVTIFNYLVVNGIDRKRLSYTGHSNKQPKVYPEITEDDRIQNRRVRIEFVKI